jgi:aspartyl-tRNA(Asn)/glutamyl-tRNA(Gln) amidotransferase subunit C
MKISKDEVARVAALARLKCDDSQLELYARQLDDILQYMDTLNELDTSEVEPLYSPVFHERATRDDEVRQETSREEVLSNAPETDGTYFVVPKVF